MDHNRAPSNSRQYLISQQSFDAYNPDDCNRRRSSTWNGEDGVYKTYTTSNGPIPLAIVDKDHSVNDKIKRFTFNMERKSKSLKKLREIVEKVLRKNLDHCHYNAELSRKRCTHISQILETTLRSSLNVDGSEYKVVAIVHIGEIRGDGMKQSCQYNWNPDTDFFVIGTYRRDDMFATGVVFATALGQESEETFDERVESYELMI